MLPVKGVIRKTRNHEKADGSFAKANIFSPCHRLASGRCSAVKMRTRFARITFGLYGFGYRRASVFALSSVVEPIRAQSLTLTKIHPRPPFHFAKQNEGFDSLRISSKKEGYTRINPCVPLFFGGPDGSRTRVRKPLNMTFSGCILCFVIPLGKRSQTSFCFG